MLEEWSPQRPYASDKLFPPHLHDLLPFQRVIPCPLPAQGAEDETLLWKCAFPEPRVPWGGGERQSGPEQSTGEQRESPEGHRWASPFPPRPPAVPCPRRKPSFQRSHCRTQGRAAGVSRVQALETCLGHPPWECRSSCNACSFANSGYGSGHKSMSSSNLGEEQMNPSAAYKTTEREQWEWPKRSPWSRDGQPSESTPAAPPEEIYPAGESAGCDEVRGPS